MVSGATLALIAHIGTRHKVLTGARNLGKGKVLWGCIAGAVDTLEPHEPLTCGLLPLFIEKICRAYGGAGGEPLQPRPGFKLDRKTGRVSPRTAKERQGCSLGSLPPTAPQARAWRWVCFAMMEVIGGWGNIPSHCHCGQSEGQPEFTHCSQLLLRKRPHHLAHQFEWLQVCVCVWGGYSVGTPRALSILGKCFSKSCPSAHQF